MPSKLPLMDILLQSIKYLAQNMRLTGCFFVFSFAAIYFIQRFHTAGSQSVMFLYMLYTYLFYYLFVVVFFQKRPLFSKENFINAAIRIFAVLLLAFAVLLLIKAGFSLLFLIVLPLRAYPETYAMLRDAYIVAIKSPYTLYIVYAGVFGLLTFIFFIPAFAWVSAAIGKDASITMTFVKTQNNYLRLFCIFLSVYGILPLTVLLLIPDPVWLVSAVSAFLTLLQITIYLTIYRFFYEK